MPTLKWSIIPPSEPGWYWAYFGYLPNGEAYTVEVVQVVEVDGVLTAFTTEDDVQSLEIFFAWQGPLPVPEVPRKILDKEKTYV